jgi:hypothetical protein
LQVTMPTCLHVGGRNCGSAADTVSSVGGEVAAPLYPLIAPLWQQLGSWRPGCQRWRTWSGMVYAACWWQGAGGNLGGRAASAAPSLLLFGGGEFHGVGDIFITATSISDRVVTFARVVGAAMGGGA